MKDALLVLNAGSSSIKFSVFELIGGAPAVFVKGQIEGLNTAPRFIARDGSGETVAERQWDAGATLDHAGAIEHLTGFLGGYRASHRLVAVGHRIVHGGVSRGEPVRIDARVLDELEQLNPLAPLHQPHNLAPVRLLLERRPALPQVACFDTAFHVTAPEVARIFALPQEMTESGIRRYGFHGLSYEYIASALGKLDPRAAAGRTIVLHLGNGASMCAMNAGHSVATTMGFTAIEGLPMGTRCGALDPGVVLYLIEQQGMQPGEVGDLLYKQSGLLGVSGVSSDMRVLLASDEPRARLAVDLYVYRIGRELGSLAAALGGLDAIVFTAGIGENAAPIRERVCQDAGWLGVGFDPAANAAHGPRISTAGSPVSAWVVPTDEEMMIARHTQRVLAVG